MPSALGISGTYQAIRSSNGPAQHIAVSLVGITYAGIFSTVVPHILLMAWAASSLLVLIATVWLRKIWLKRALLLAFVLSCAVLTFYFMHDSPPTEAVYYVMTANGMQAGSRGQDPMSMIDIFSRGLACVITAGWTLMLASLVQRQMLEAQRFEAAFEGEVLK